MTTALDLEGRVWFNPDQAAVYSGWSRRTVLRALRAGELKGAQLKERGHWRIHRDALDEWLGGGTR